MAKRNSKARIKQVSFRGNIAVDGKFQHVHIEAIADVPPGEDPSVTLDVLKEWVGEELKVSRDGVRTEVVAPARRFRV